MADALRRPRNRQRSWRRRTGPSTEWKGDAELGNTALARGSTTRRIHGHDRRPRRVRGIQLSDVARPVVSCRTGGLGGAPGILTRRCCWRPNAREQFLDVFAAYNRMLWPAALLLWLATLIAVVLLLRRDPRAPRIVALLLAAHWAWSGAAYHLAFFRSVSPAATLFGALFVAQAALFLGNHSVGLHGGRRVCGVLIRRVGRSCATRVRCPPGAPSRVKTMPQSLESEWQP